MGMKLNELAEMLLQKEVIFREDLEHIFGVRPFEDHEHVEFSTNGETKAEPATLPENTESAKEVPDDENSESKDKL